MGTVRHITVTQEEAGQKLLQFLQRRLGGIPQSAVMRWLRTGQVRVNKGRAKAYDRLAAGDVVRVPPCDVAYGTFSQPAASHTPHTPHTPGTPGTPAAPHSPYSPATPAPPGVSGGAGAPAAAAPASPVSCGAGEGLNPDDVAARLAREGLELAGNAPGLLVLRKPAGLPVQPGTGHADAVTVRLARCFAGAPFMPAPAHRLDKDTSGLLLVATEYRRLRALHELFRQGGGLRKVYLAWVRGAWLPSEPVRLEDRLDKRVAGSGERVVRVAGTEQGREASCTVYSVKPGKDCSLVAVWLHTGRTHQIRVQLAGQGHPIMGDRKYGGPACAQGMLLHAWHMALPGMPGMPEERSGRAFVPGLPGLPDASDTSGTLCAASRPDAASMSGVPAEAADHAGPAGQDMIEAFFCPPEWTPPYAVDAALLQGFVRSVFPPELRRIPDGLPIDGY